MLSDVRPFLGAPIIVYVSPLTLTTSPFSPSDNFMPESVDPAKPGTIEVKRTKESASVTVERASVQVGFATLTPLPAFAHTSYQSGETGHSFVGTETIAKEWECVLIYDEEMGVCSLSRLFRSFLSMLVSQMIDFYP